MRTHPVAVTLASRAVRTPEGFSFENGIHVPQGEVLSFSPLGMIDNEDNLDGKVSATKFSGFRFASDSTQSAILTECNERFLSWGIGRHAWSVPVTPYMPRKPRFLIHMN